MLMTILSTVIFFGFLCLWLLPPYLKQGKQDKLPFRWILFTMLGGAVVAGGISIGLQLLLDRWQVAHIEGLAGQAFSAFISAALVEELTKFLVARVMMIFAKPVRKIDVIFLFAASGVGFEILETVLGFSNSGSIAGAILRGVICLHVFLQMFMGIHYDACQAAKAAGKKVRAVLQMVVAFLLPILVHGLNDFSLFFMQMELNSYSALPAGAEMPILLPVSVVSVAVAVIADLVFIIHSLVVTYREAKRSRAAEAAAAANQVSAE